MNEVFMFVIGSYLFIFLDDSISETQSKFYGWVIIAIVVIQVLINISIMFPYKIYEFLSVYKERH